jgi:hypothetical protein
VLNALRPKPFRGDVIAAGVVVLATLVWLVRVRFAAAWGDGGQLVWAAVPWAFVTLLALLAELEGDAPRAYQSVLYIASVVLWIAVVLPLGEVLGADGAFVNPGVTTAETGAIALLAFGFAIGRNSAVSTLLGALFGGAAVIALVEWVFSPAFATFRWVLLGLMVVYGFAAIGQRDRHLRHGVALIDAAGTAVLAIGASFLLGGSLIAPLYAAVFIHVDPAALGFGHAAGVGWGWELLIVAAGFGLIAYSSIDRQPGPAYLGVINLLVFAYLSSLNWPHGPTFLGWPLVLAIAAAALLIIGLRPTTPAPPPPDVDAPEAPPLPLR